MPLRTLGCVSQVMLRGALWEEREKKGLDPINWETLNLTARQDSPEPLIIKRDFVRHLGGSAG